MIQQEQSRKSFDPVLWVMALAVLVLVVLSVRFAEERVIFTDTSIYMYVMADTGHPYIATNRFVCLLSQALPLAGIALGVSLKTAVYLYSINCILIPLLCSFLCLRVFRNKAAALAILLFYVIISAWVFYYPVSEFQMGLCLLLLYHAYVLWFLKKEKQRSWLFAMVSLVLVTTIIFSHPLSLYVYLAWTTWVFLNHPESRKRLLLLPPAMALAAHFIKEHFFKALVGGTLSYDDQKKQGLEHFKAPVHTYFDSVLGKGAIHALSSDYFVVLGLFVVLLLLYAWRRQWLTLLFFAGVVPGFWLLVTVSFRDWPYDHYPEHLYQPVPFFIALAFASALPLLFRKGWLGALCILVVFGISLAKINSNHRYYSNRLAWYREYSHFMQAQHIRNATLSSGYTVYGIKDSYWGSGCESMLVSGLDGPDKAVRIVVDGNATHLNESWTGQSISSSPYFGKITERVSSLDSIYPVTVLDSLKQRTEGR